MEADPSLGAIRFRAMGHVDLESVMKIEAQSYEFPWSRGIFEDCLAAPYECWAGELEDREGRNEIVGYGILQVSGDEAKEFLQNIVTNDIEKVSKSFTLFSSIAF